MIEAPASIVVLVLDKPFQRGGHRCFAFVIPADLGDHRATLGLAAARQARTHGCSDRRHEIALRRRLLPKIP